MSRLEPDSRDVSVVYRRKDGKYGVIQPGTDEAIAPDAVFLAAK